MAADGWAPTDWHTSRQRYVGLTCFGLVWYVSYAPSYCSSVTSPVRAQFICPTAPLSSRHSWPQDGTSSRSKSFSSPLLDSGEVSFWSTQPEIWSSGNPSVRRQPFRQIHWSKKIWSLDFVAICGEADHQLRRLCIGPPTTMAPGGRGINLRDWEQTRTGKLFAQKGRKRDPTQINRVLTSAFIIYYDIFTKPSQSTTVFATGIISTWSDHVPGIITHIPNWPIQWCAQRKLMTTDSVMSLRQNIGFV